MWNAGLYETQAGIKIARRNINNLRYADDTTLMVESEQEGERGEWKRWLKAQHSENKDHGIRSHHFMAEMGKQWNQWQALFGDLPLVPRRRGALHPSWTERGLSAVLAAGGEGRSGSRWSPSCPFLHLKGFHCHCTSPQTTPAPCASFSFSCGPDSKEFTCNEGDPGSIPGWGRSPGEGNGNPLQYSCLGNLKDGEAWWVTVHGVIKRWTWLSSFPLTFKIPAEGNLSHEIKRHLLLGRKVVTNLDNVLKSISLPTKIRDITLPTNVSIVKPMVFPVVVYGWKSWTIKKAEHWRIDAFELWCWRRLLGVPLAARRSTQSILKDINFEYSLEGLKLKLKLQCFGHLIGRTDSFEKTLMLGKIEGRRRREWERTRSLDDITNSMDMSLSKLWEMVRDSWRAAVRGFTKSWTWLSDNHTYTHSSTT